MPDSEALQQFDLSYFLGASVGASVGFVVDSAARAALFITRTAFNSAHYLNYVSRGYKVYVGVASVAALGVTLTTITLASFTSLSGVIGLVGTVGFAILPVIDASYQIMITGHEWGILPKPPEIFETILQYDSVYMGMHLLKSLPIWTELTKYLSAQLTLVMGIGQLTGMAQSQAADAASKISGIFTDLKNPSQTTLIGIALIGGIVGLTALVTHFFKEEKKEQVKAEPKKPSAKAIKQKELENLVAKIQVSISNDAKAGENYSYTGEQLKALNDKIKEHNKKNPNDQYYEIETINFKVTDPILLNPKKIALEADLVKLTESLKVEKDFLDEFKERAEQNKPVLAKHKIILNGGPKIDPASFLNDTINNVEKDSIKKQEELEAQITNKLNEIRELEEKIRQAKPEDLNPILEIKSKEPEKAQEQSKGK